MAGKSRPRSPTKSAGSGPVACKSPQPLRPALMPLRPIYPPTDAEDGDTESNNSRNMSRRSSSSGSSVISGKCVHFPCNPSKLSSFHVTHSRDQYDRSPIIPSGGDLDIPSCKSESEGNWIRCLQRKAKEAAEDGHAPPFAPYMYSLTKSSLESGFGSQSSSSSSEDGTDFSPTESSTSSVIQDDGSSDMEDLSSIKLNASCHDRTPSLEMFLSLSHQATDDTDKIQFTHCETYTEMYTEMYTDDYEQGEYHVEAELEEDGDRPLGMCGLGKFTRTSLYSDNDVFGGF